MIYDILIPTCKTYDEVNILMDEISTNTPEPHRIIASCQNICASGNRNFCYLNAKSEIQIMLDDDITGFKIGWLSSLVQSLNDDNNMLVSARLLNKDGGLAHTMSGNYDTNNDMIFVEKAPTACIAYRKFFLDQIIDEVNKPFDENFLGSGFEDDDICILLKKKFPDKRFIITNKCKLIHLNDMKNQKGDNWEKNKKYIIQKHPWHPVVWH